MTDEIRKCLNCERPKCTNCLGDSYHPRRFQTVFQIDPITEKVVGTFSGIVDAGKATGINPGCISAAVRGRYKTAGGYIWKRKR